MEHTAENSTNFMENSIMFLFTTSLFLFFININQKHHFLSGSTTPFIKLN